jgi:hypothetical protein
MKYNKREQVERSIKKELLRDALLHLDLSKQASIEKEGMATYRGQKDLSTMVNLKRVSPHPGKRIQEIANTIAEQFKSFLRSRLKPAQGGDNKLYVKVPVLREGVPMEESFSIPTVPVESMGEEFNPTIGKDKKIKSAPVKSFFDLASDELDPAQPDQKMDLKGLVPQGCIYYRYGYTRTVLPDGESNPEEYELAVDHLTEFQQALEKNGVRFDWKSFISDMEELGVALMPGFNYAQVPSKKVVQWVEMEAQQAMARRQSGQRQVGDEAILALKQYVDDFKAEQAATPRGRGQPPAPFGIGNRKEYFLYDGSPPTGEDFVSPQIKMLTNERALARMIEAKIKCGYKLNVRGLVDTIYRYIYAAAKKQERASITLDGKRTFTKKVTVHTLKVLARQWDHQLPHMINVYRSIEEGVKNEEAKFAAVSAHGLNWEGNKKFQRLVAPKVGDKAISWNYVHFQMILQNITAPAPDLRRYPLHIKVKKYQFFDPSSSLTFYCDGISQRTGVRSQKGKRAAILPPFIEPRYLRTKGNEHEESLEEYIEPEEIQDNNLAQLTYQGINLGLAHLAYNGSGVTSLLQKWGPQAEQVLPVLKAAKFKSLFNDQNDPAHAVVNTYPNAYMGSESLSRMLYEIAANGNPAEELQKRIAGVKISGKSGREAKNAFDAQNWPLLQKYAYPLAKVMEIVYGLIHAANETEFRFIDPATGSVQPFIMYGQSYGTSSGIGQGGEILLSVRYAYKTKLDQYAGNESAAIKIIKDEYAKQGHELRIPANMSPASETQFPQKGDVDEGPISQEGTPLGQPKPGCTFVSNFQFFIGQSSSLPTKSGKYSMFNTVVVSHDWQDCVAQLRRLYSNGKLAIDEASGDFIWDINADLDHLENAIHAALTHAKDQIANIAITVTDRNNDVEYIAPGEVPDGTLTDQQAEQVGQQSEMAVNTRSKIEPAPTDEVETQAKPPAQQQPVAVERTLQTAFPQLQQILQGDPQQVTPDQILRALPKRIDEQTETAVTNFLSMRYDKLQVEEAYGELFDKYNGDAGKIIPSLLKYFKREDAVAAQWEANARKSREQPQPPAIAPAAPAPAPAPTEEPVENVAKAPEKSMFRRYDPNTNKSLVHSSIQERLVTLANTFDSKGLKSLADKIDRLLICLNRTDL